MAPAPASSPHAAGAVAHPGTFHLDHTGTKVGENECGVAAGHESRKIQYLELGEWKHDTTRLRYLRSRSPHAAGETLTDGRDSHRAPGLSALFPPCIRSGRRCFPGRAHIRGTRAPHIPSARVPPNFVVSLTWDGRSTSPRSFLRPLRAPSPRPAPRAQHRPACP